MSNSVSSGAAARFVAITALDLAGGALLVASPFLLFLGGWAGADATTVGNGIAWVLGIPWLIFLACTAAAALALRRRRPALACLPAVVPLLVELWLVVR